MNDDDVKKLANLGALLGIHDAGQLMDVGLFLSQQPRTVLTCRCSHGCAATGFDQWGGLCGDCYGNATRGSDVCG